ncbi:MAG: chemotaxis protein CheX [Isosphaeraceae bacterium]
MTEVGEQSLRDAVRTVWSTVLGLEIAPDAPGPAPQRGVRGLVKITGRWQGAVTMDCPRDLARQAAALMLGVEPGETTPVQIHDAVGELTNMIGGNVKPLLPRPCKLAPPEVVDGAIGCGEPLEFQAFTSLGFHCLDTSFRVTIRRDGPA